jgi:hypothetical protein
MRLLTWCATPADLVRCAGFCLAPADLVRCADFVLRRLLSCAG